MLGSIKRMWLGSDPVEFESAFGLDESEERLRAVTRRWALFATKETAAGAVSESRVSLQRVTPMVGNAFKLFFVGRFERRNGKVILTGRFTMNPIVKIFMTVWLGGCALFAAAGVLAVLESPESGPLPLVGVGMLAFGFALTYFGNWLSRNDPSWLSGVISDALDARMTSSPADLSSLRLDRRSRERHLKGRYESGPVAGAIWCDGMCFGGDGYPDVSQWALRFGDHALQ